MLDNDWGKPTVSYRWTGWVWEIPIEVQDFMRIIDHTLDEFMEYTSNEYRKTKGCQHVTSWTCKHHDLNQLCLKISPITIVLECSFHMGYKKC